MKKLVIIGASGHGKVAADIAKKNGYMDIVFLDDNLELSRCGEYPVVGSVKEYANYTECEFFVAIGNAEIREKMQKLLSDNIVSLIHPNAYIASDVCIGQGSIVMAGCVVNSGAKIAKGCIINTCSSVDHDCYLDDYVHIAVGAHVAGMVTIGKSTWIGAGATIINNVNICDNCVIGAGAVVISDLSESGTYIGIPAHKK